MLTNFIWWIIVGLIAGWAAGKIMKGGGYGAVMDIVLGIIGAVVGGWLLGALGIYPGGGIHRHHRGGDHWRHLPDLAHAPAQEGLKVGPHSR